MSYDYRFDTFDQWWNTNAYESVLNYYRENKLTYYHRTPHILDCWTQLSDDSIIGCVTDELKFALLYHDVVYDPRAKDNEEKSAGLAILELSDVYRKDDVGLNKIVELILITKHSGETTVDPESQCMLDIDLSILGSPTEKYKLYAENIRREYSFVSHGDYARGRITFLSGLLQRPKIYYKLTHLEQRARKNINNEILYLRGQL